MLPEKWPVLGTAEETAAGAEPLDGPALTWARATARELGIDLVAGSIVERGDGPRDRNTCVHVGPDGDDRAVYRKLHMFDVEVGGARVPRVRARGRRATRSCVSHTAGGVELGLTVCYDLRFPELYRALAVRGARVITVPSAFTLCRRRATTGRSCCARARDRGPVLRGRRQPGRRGTGPAACARAGAR